MSRRFVPSGWLPCAALVVLTVLQPSRSAAGGENLDIQLANRALQKLRSDPQLRPLELIVMVKDRAATVRGVVPSRELIQRALTCVRTIPEFTEVRDQCSVGRQLDPPLATVEPRPKQVAPPAAVVQSDKIPGKWVPGYPDSLKIASPWKEEPPDAKVAAVLDLPPIRIGLGVPAPESTWIKAISRPRLPEPASASLEQTVQRLTLHDGRYYRLQLEVRDRAIFISGVALRWEDVHTLSRTLTELPGVERVVWRNIRTEGHR